MNKRSEEKDFDKSEAGRYSNLEPIGYKKFSFINKESPRNSVIEAR